jgi:hypothetical protein
MCQIVARSGQYRRPLVLFGFCKLCFKEGPSLFFVEVPRTFHFEPSPPNGISIHIQRIITGASMAETPTQVSVAVADQENAAPTDAPLQVDV